MMKKRLLMPLIAAGVMVTSVVMFNACKKTDGSANKVDLKSIVKTEISVEADGRDGDMPFFFCPYCDSLVWNYDTTHWHTFGRKGDIVGEYENFNDCRFGIGNHTMGCQYSGDWYGLFPETTNDTYVARYHGHRVKLASDGGSGSQNDYVNSWHVGGGVPGWPNP